MREYWQTHPGAKQPLQAWYTNVKRADWKTPNDVKVSYRNASFVANNRVIFNIKGNSYRLVVAINYEYRIVYIRFIGTHKEYDRIQISTV